MLLRYSAAVVILVLPLQLVFASPMQPSMGHKISGVIVDHKGNVLSGIAVIVHGMSGEQRTSTNDAGQFNLDVADEEVRLRVEGQYISSQEQVIRVTSLRGDLRIEADYLIPPMHQSIVTGCKHP